MPLHKYGLPCPHGQGCVTVSRTTLYCMDRLSMRVCTHFGNAVSSCMPCVHDRRHIIQVVGWPAEVCRVSEISHDA